MPYEVFPVLGPQKDKSPTEGDHFTRGLDEVATDIASIYDKVAQKSGEIIASHLIDIAKAHDGSHTNEPADMYQGQALFLVAELPEAEEG